MDKQTGIKISSLDQAEPRSAIMETYRFTNVPDSYTEDDIRALFSACDQSTVNSVCLARSVYTEHAAVATVSFTQPPSFVQKFIPGGTDLHPQPKKRSLVAAFNSPLSSLGIDDPTKKIVVDNDFEGLTPLVESRGDDTIVEYVCSGTYKAVTHAFE
jgi:hypothetical protein